MPTPFSHLALAQRLLNDEEVPAAVRALIHAERPAFTLGSVAADGHMMCGLRREDTHFYAYDRPMENHPWRVMLARFPTLARVESPAWRAFLAGYVAHLTMDEVWTLEMTAPHFAGREWASRAQRFFMLHILLIHMDERDLALLQPDTAELLHAAQPQGWLPFMRDAGLSAWGELIHRQIASRGASETLDILGPRVGRTPEEIRAVLDSPERMETELWANIPRTLLAEVEAHMYARARADLIAYLA